MLLCRCRVFARPTSWLAVSLVTWWSVTQLSAQTRPIEPPPPPQLQQPYPPVAEAGPSVQLNAPARIGDGVQQNAGVPSALQPSPTTSTTQAAGDSAAAIASAVSQANAQTNVSTLVPEMKASIQGRLDQLEADLERTSEAKDAIKSVYQQALISLDKALKSELKKQDWNARASNAPGQIEIAKAAENELSQSSADQAAESISEVLGFEESQARLRELAPELAAATVQRESLTQETNAREQRRKELPQLISELRSKVEAAQRVTTPEAVDPTDVVAAADSFLSLAKNLAAREQLRELESEQRAYEAEASLLPIQLKLAQAREKQLQDQARAFETRIDELRKGRISGFRIQYRLLPAVDDPAFVSIDAQLRSWIGDDTTGQSKPNSQETSLTWPDVAAYQKDIKTERELAKAELDRWTEIRGKMTARTDAEEVTGVNKWIGLRLRKQRGELPNLNLQSVKLREHQAEIQQAESVLFDLEDAARELQKLRESRSKDLSESEQEKLAVADKILAESKLDINAYRNELYDMADIRESLQTFTREYRIFIDKHVLWIRSTEPLTRTELKSIHDAFRWLVDLNSWTELGRLLWQDAKSNVAVYVFFVFAFGVLVINQRRLRVRLGKLSEKAARNTCTDYSLTLRATLITFLISTPVPLMLLFLAWRIRDTSQLDIRSNAQLDFFLSVAYGLHVGTMTFAPLELLRQAYRSPGLGTNHFAWSQGVLQNLKRHLRWFINFAVPLSALVGVFASQPNARFDATLGRLAFMLLMVCLCVWLATVFSPKVGVFSEHIRKHQDGWIDRLKVFWYPAVILLPLLLAILSFAGYHYTSQQIAIQVLTTAWMLASLTLVNYLLRRWLLLKRRRLMMAAARQRLEAAARGESGEAGTEESELNLVAINTQTEKLVTSLVFSVGLLGVYWIWSNIIPALELLDSFELWEVAGDGSETATITLRNVVLLIPVVVLVIIAVRNVPGLLEIALLQHLPLSPAAKYAVTTLVRYAIMGLGIVIVGATLGLRWSSIQWLVAALGVGLGFGLQEIFANFVSGVILLFEQPIRVGDVITVDGTTGTVNRIRMRATTVVNWDRQELVIPNKNMITGTLLNWTLSDSTNRVVVNVGIAYGSDTEKACDLIRQVCEQQANVMKDPPPVITFEGFGDNALNIVLRVYLSALEHRLNTIHALHQQIYLAFGKAGIEIAFPQRDLHLRSIPDSLTRLLRLNGHQSSEATPVHKSAVHSN